MADEDPERSAEQAAFGYQQPEHTAQQFSYEAYSGHIFACGTQPER